MSPSINQRFVYFFELLVVIVVLRLIGEAGAQTTAPQGSTSVHRQQTSYADWDIDSSICDVCGEEEGSVKIASSNKRVPVKPATLSRASQADVSSSQCPCTPEGYGSVLAEVSILKNKTVELSLIFPVKHPDGPPGTAHLTAGLYRDENGALVIDRNAKISVEQTAKRSTHIGQTDPEFVKQYRIFLPASEKSRAVWESTCDRSVSNLVFDVLSHVCTSNPSLTICSTSKSDAQAPVLSKQQDLSAGNGLVTGRSISAGSEKPLMTKWCPKIGGGVCQAAWVLWNYRNIENENKKYGPCRAAIKNLLKCGPTGLFLNVDPFSGPCWDPPPGTGDDECRIIGKTYTNKETGDTCESYMLDVDYCNDYFYEEGKKTCCPFIGKDGSVSPLLGSHHANNQCSESQTRSPWTWSEFSTYTHSAQCVTCGCEPNLTTCKDNQGKITNCCDATAGEACPTGRDSGCVNCSTRGMVLTEEGICCNAGQNVCVGTFPLPAASQHKECCDQTCTSHPAPGFGGTWCPRAPKNPEQEPEEEDFCPDGRFKCGGKCCSIAQECHLEFASNTWVEVCRGKETSSAEGCPSGVYRTGERGIKTCDKAQH
jgi:hypothetical protein